MGHLIRDDDLIEETLVVRDGAIQVPSGPGIGVALDREAVDKHARNRLVFET